MTVDPAHLKQLLSAATLQEDDDCEHIECGHLVGAERAQAELMRAVPQLISVFEAACAWRDANRAGYVDQRNRAERILETAIDRARATGE